MTELSHKPRVQTTKVIIFAFFIGWSWRRDTKCDCKIDWLWVRTPLKELKYLFTFTFSFLCSGVEANAVLSSTRRWGTECLNTRFPLPTLLCARYSVKLI